jgi:hypothetical protein
VKNILAKPGWTLIIFLVLLISVLIGGKTSAINGPFDQSSIFGITNATLFLLIVCWISVSIGFFYSQNLTYGNGPATFIRIIQGILIALFTIYIFKEYNGNFLWSSLLSTVTISIIGLMIGITGGDMTEPPWLGDVLFINQVKKQMINRNISLLNCDNEGMFHIVNPKEIIVSWDQKAKIVVLRNRNEPLSNFAPVTIRDNQNDITNISCAFNKFEDIYENCNTSWRGYMSEHYNSLKFGVQRMHWVLLLLKTIPHSPLSLGNGKELMGTMARKITVMRDGSPIAAYIVWESASSSFGNFIKGIPQFRHTEVHDSPLHTALGSKDSGILDVEREIIGHLYRGENDSSVYFLRNFSNLMITLQGEYIQNTGSKSEICRLTINAMAEWFHRVLKTKKEVFPDHVSSNKSHAISLELWSYILEETITQPATLFLRFHDRVTPFIEEDTYVTDLRVKRFFDEIISESIENALQTSSVDIKNNTMELETSRRGHNHNRVAALLVGVCSLLLLISLYDEPERGAGR